MDRVERLLHVSEKCKFVCEVMWVVSEEVKKPLTLSLVYNKNIKPIEYAVFFHEKPGDSSSSVFTLRACHPITVESGLKFNGESQVEIFFRNSGDVYAVEPLALSHMWSLSTHLSRAMQSAFNLLHSSSTHGWLENYREMMDRPVQVGSIREPREVTGSSPGPGSSAMGGASAASSSSSGSRTTRAKLIDLEEEGGGGGASLGSSAGNRASSSMLGSSPSVLPKGVMDVEKGTPVSATPVTTPAGSKRGKIRSSPGTSSTGVSESFDAREVWLREQMRNRESEFTERQSLKVVLGTWNVASKKSKEDMSTFLQAQLGADVYGFGLQEIDMTAGALLTENNSSGRWWDSFLLEQMNANPAGIRYHKIQARQLVGMFLVVFVREELMDFVTNVKSAQQACGFIGIMGNKGAVAVRFNIHETSFCIVNAHLSPHLDNVMRRNNNFKTIMEKLAFSDAQYTRIMHHDYVFFIGDLNYRIGLNRSDVLEKIRTKQFAYLQEYDQLCIQKKLGNVFQGFTEGEITFAPSYKFDPGTNNYDTGGKSRVPAWTDRVLWTVRNPQSHPCEQLSYTSHLLSVSDHKPVSSIFRVEARQVVQDREHAVLAELLKVLDRMENELLPEITLSNNSFSFEDVTYGVPVSMFLHLQNVGKVLVEYSFARNPISNLVCKPWLLIDPPAGIVDPGSTQEIMLTVVVGADTAPALNTGEEILEDILILHLENGRDHFISISGNYLASCFGNNLEHLVTIPGPLRSILPQSESAAKLKVPKELWRLVDFLYQHGLLEVGLFDENGVEEEVQQVREILDTGASFEEFGGSIHSVAEALVQWLSSLEVPVVPPQFYRKCLDCCNARRPLEDAEAVVRLFPAVHFNVFHYLVAFCKEVLAHSSDNHLTPDRLAFVFSAALLRCPVDASGLHHVDTRQACQFLMHFLTADTTARASSSSGPMLLDT